MNARIHSAVPRAFLTALLLAPSLRADNGTWLGASGLWGEPATWNGGFLAEGVDFTANFTGVDITANQIVTLAAPQTIGNIIFTDATTASHDLTLSGVGTLTLDVTSGNPVINVTQSGRTLTIDGVIGGADGLRKIGAGTLVLATANTYTGGTILSAGAVTVSNAAGFGADGVSVTGTARINVVGGITYANAIDVGAPLTLHNPAGTPSTATYTGPLTGSNSITLQNGGGNGILAGHAFTHTNNTFTGNVIFPSGSVAGDDRFSFTSIGDAGNFTFQKRGHQNAVVHTGATHLTFNTRQIAIGGQFGGGLFDGGGVTPINRFMNNGAGTVTFNTDVTPGVIHSNGTFFFDGTNTGDNTFAGVISNPTSGGNLGIGKNGAGKWVLTGNNSYLGNTVVAQGTLSVTALQDTVISQPLGKGPILQLGHQGNNGTIELNLAANAATDKQVQLGNATAAQGGAGTIANNGAGTVTFTNPVFNPAISGITASRTLTLSGTHAGANTIAGTIQNNAAAGAVVLTKTGTGTWVLAGANTFTGAVTITGTASGNTLRLAHNEALGPVATAKTVSLTGNNRQVSILELANTITVDINKAVSTSGKSFMAAGETAFGSPVFLRNESGNNTWRGNIIIGATGGAYSIESAAGTLTLGDPGTASFLRNQVAGGNTRTFDFRGAGNVVVNAKIAANGLSQTGINKYGTGTLTLPRTDNDGNLTTPNLSVGTTVVENMAASGAPSSIGAGSSFNFGDTFRHVGANDSTCNRAFGLVGPAPTLESSGAGSLALTSTTPVNLVAGAGTTVAAFTAGATVLTANDVHNLMPGMMLTGSNIAAGTRISAVHYDARQITLDTPATGNQPTHLAVTFSGAGDLDRTFTLGGTNPGDNRIAAPIPNPSGTGKLGVTKTGAGSWTLDGPSTYNGPTTVVEGALHINGSLGGTGAVTVASAALLGGTGSIAGPVTVQSGGRLAPGNGGIGQITFTGNLDVQGTLAIETNGVTNDLVRGVAQLNLGPASVLDLSGTLVAASQVIVRYTTRAGSFAGVGDVTAQGYEVVYDDLAGEVRLQTLPATLTVPAAPAPGLSWPTRIGRSYTLQYRPELTSGDWSDVPGYINLPGTGSPITLPALITADPRGYYRMAER